MQQAMTALRSDRTSFVIAHRLSTIRDADLILVMEDGRIVEQGTHDELLDRRGAYFGLYNAQFVGARRRGGARARHAPDLGAALRCRRGAPRGAPLTQEAALSVGATLLALAVALALVVAPGFLLSYAGPRTWDVAQRLALAPGLSLGSLWAVVTVVDRAHLLVTPVSVTAGLVIVVGARRLVAGRRPSRAAVDRRGVVARPLGRRRDSRSSSCSASRCGGSAPTASARSRRTTTGPTTASGPSGSS